MTTKEKLYAISEEEACMDAEWHRPFTFKTALGWFLRGRSECSPVQASGLLKCDAYTLNVKARYLETRGVDRIGGVHFRFSGRNLRLNLIDLLVRCGWEREDLLELRLGLEAPACATDERAKAACAAEG